MHIKPEIRILAIDDSALVSERIMIVGVVFRGGEWMDGVLRAEITRDGLDATDVIAEMVTATRHYPQIRVIMLDGVTYGGFNVVDIAKVTFYQRPSVANNQKRAFQKKMDKFTSEVKSSKYTDISGGLSQAVEYLNKADPGKKYILIFSDLKEELKKGHVRDVPFQLAGFNVIALNITKLRADILDPKKYMKRVERWRKKIESGNGQWRVVNDLERLDNIFSE